MRDRMRRFLLGGLVLTALVCPAAAETFTLPGTDLSVTLPDGRYTVQNVAPSGETPTYMLVSVDGLEGWSGIKVDAGCAAALVAGTRNGGHLEATSNVPAGWYAQRGVQGTFFSYCRDLDASHAMVVIVLSHATASQHAASAARVLAAVEAAIAPPAAASSGGATKTVKLPGDELMISVPSDFQSDGTMLISAHGASFLARRQGGTCAPLMQALASQSPGTFTVEPAPEALSTWATVRLQQATGRMYCRELANRETIWLSVMTMDGSGQDADAQIVMRAIDAALPATATPVQATTIDVEKLGTIAVPSGYRVREHGVESADGVAFLSFSVDAGTCAEYFVSAETTGPFTSGPPSWSKTWGASDDGRWYCRDLAQGGRLVLGALTNGKPTDALDRYALPAMQAVEAAIGGAAPTSAYTPTSTPTPAPVDSSYVPPPSGDGSASSDYHYREPASYDTARWGLAGGQSTLDAGMATHIYGAARVTFAPRSVEDYDETAFAFGAGLSAGAAGDAFVGDAYASGGYGVGGEGIVVRALAVVGVDRVGGGFEPQSGAYLGLQGFVRIGFGKLAFEGDGMITTSSGVDETRAQVSAVTHIGDRVVALGGFYQRWDALAEIYGVALSVTR
jgi:hypothetical protein